MRACAVYGESKLGGDEIVEYAKVSQRPCQCPSKQEGDADAPSYQGVLSLWLNV